MRHYTIPCISTPQTFCFNLSLVRICFLNLSDYSFLYQLIEHLKTKKKAYNEAAAIGKQQKQ